MEASGLLCVRDRGLSRRVQPWTRLAAPRFPRGVRSSADPTHPGRLPNADGSQCQIQAVRRCGTAIRRPADQALPLLESDRYRGCSCNRAYPGSGIGKRICVQRPHLALWVPRMQRGPGNGPCHPLAQAVHMACVPNHFGHQHDQRVAIMLMIGGPVGASPRLLAVFAGTGGCRYRTTIDDGPLEMWSDARIRTCDPDLLSHVKDGWVTGFGPAAHPV